MSVARGWATGRTRSGVRGLGSTSASRGDTEQSVKGSDGLQASRLGSQVSCLLGFLLCEPGHVWNASVFSL